MGSRALVLGGGGPVGIAWESGLLAGLAQSGVDLGQADFILGTSAGAFVGARMALGADVTKLAEPIFADAERAVRPVSRAAPPPDLSKLMRLMVRAQEAERDQTEVLAEIGAYALETPTMSEEAFIESFGRSFASLPDDAWPDRGFACTAIDVETGAFQVWTKESSVGVTRAVASSCALPGAYPPITVQGRRWMDGGARSSTNADLATGYDLVVIVGIRTNDMTPGGALVRVFSGLEREVEELVAGGARVVTLLPDEASRTAMGGNVMEFRKRPDAARAGLAQGAAEAAALKALWG